MWQSSLLNGKTWALTPISSNPISGNFSSTVFPQFFFKMEHDGRNGAIVPIPGTQFAGSFVPALRLLESQRLTIRSQSPWTVLRLYLTDEWTADHIWKSAVRVYSSNIYKIISDHAKVKTVY